MHPYSAIFRHLRVSKYTLASWLHWLSTKDTIFGCRCCVIAIRHACSRPCGRGGGHFGGAGECTGAQLARRSGPGLHARAVVGLAAADRMRDRCTGVSLCVRTSRAAARCCVALPCNRCLAKKLAGDAARKQNDAVTYMHSRAITDPWLAHHLQLQANVDLCTTPPVRLFRSGCCCCMSVLMVPTVRPINLSIILHGGWCVSAMVARV
jgi:hypothetical protein